MKKKMGSRKKAVRAVKTAKVAKPVKEKLEVVVIKMRASDRKALGLLAKRHTSSKQHPTGNLSAWLRHAGLRYTPKAGEAIKPLTRK